MRPMPTFKGTFTALVTPFRGDELDLEALDRLVDAQIDGGISGVVPCGTTGESPVLTAAEQAAVIERVVRRVRGRVPVIAGTGTNSTRETIERTKTAQKLGADAAMLVMPYYSKPTQAGLQAHVRAVHDATELPLVLYNIPGRTGCDLAAESVAEITRACARVVAVKEATGNVLRAQQLVAMLGDRISVLSGDDPLTLAMMAVGGTGVISVTSNVAPAQVQEVVRLFAAGDLPGARRANQRLLALHEALFVETNPGPIKAALWLRGQLEPELRLPLAWPSEKTIATVRQALEGVGLALTR